MRAEHYMGPSMEVSGRLKEHQDKVLLHLEPWQRACSTADGNVGLGHRSALQQEWKEVSAVPTFPVRMTHQLQILCKPIYQLIAASRCHWASSLSRQTFQTFANYSSFCF